MSNDRLVAMAESLEAAWNDARAISPPTSSDPTLTVDEAYRVQDMVITGRLSAQRVRAGWKMGLTSAEPPTTPIVGTLLSDMVVPTGSELRLDTMVAPMVEAELVVRIGETIDRPNSVAELTDGPHEIGPGLEVIDYRTTGSSSVVDWIADNSTVAFAVVGEFTPVAAVDPAAIIASLIGDGRHLATGEGRKVMGNPLAAVAWLSRHLLERDLRLEAGHVVLTGSLTGHHPVPANTNSIFTATFDTLGTVSVGFQV